MKPPSYKEQDCCCICEHSKYTPEDEAPSEYWCKKYNEDVDSNTVCKSFEPIDWGDRSGN